MVGSLSCNLYGMDEAQRIAHGEDALMPAGISSSTVRARAHDLRDLASNKIMTEFTERYNERSMWQRCSPSSAVPRTGGCRAEQKNLLEVSFPSVAGHLKFVDLMRALGMTNDQEVVNAVSMDEDILTFMMQNLEESECDSVDGGIMYVGKKLAPNQTKDYQRKRASLFLNNYLLPHLNYAMPANLKEGDEGYLEAVLSVRLAKGSSLAAWQRPVSTLC